jgi:ABC-type bacteriocin/lantibiotic exporter with double-glycine peptidase domain
VSAATSIQTTGSALPRAVVAEHTLRLLARLAADLGREFEASRASAAMDLVDSGEPLEMLCAGASAIGVRVEPRRLAVADAVWIAGDMLPIVAWSQDQARWLAFHGHGFFSARCWSTAEADSEPGTISRSGLRDALGRGELVDMGLVLAERVSEHDAHGGHATEGHHVPPIRRLITLMRPERGELWAITVFSAITGLLYLALPLAINGFVSNLSFGAQSGPFLQALVAIALVLMVCLAVAGALRAIQHVVAEVIQRRIFVRLASDLSTRLPAMDLEALRGVHAPELVNRFLDVVTVQKSASMLLLTGINLVLNAAIGLTVLAFYHPFLLAFALLLLVAIAVIIFVFGRGAVPTSIRESMRKYQVVEWFEELARHPRMFKGPGGFDMARSRADDLVRGYLDARAQHFRVLLRQISGLLALEVVAGTLLLGVGGWLVLNEQLTLGQLVAAEIIVSAIVASIAKLGKQFEAWYDAVAAVDKLGYLIDIPLDRAGGERPTVQTPMSVRAVGLGYQGDGLQRAFENVQLDLRSGDRVALHGSHGSGTSTLLEVIAGFRKASEGSVEVHGLDVRSWDLAALHGSTMMLREGDLVAGTIADNLRLGLRGVTIAQMQEAIECVGLGEAIRAMPDGLESRLITGGLPMPGRRRIRLLVARALVARPRLLLVDELLDGLDEATTSQLCEILTAPSRDWTLVVSTRDLRVAERVGRRIDLDSIRESGHA